MSTATKTYPVTGHATSGAVIPGLLPTAAELQGMCSSGDWSQIWCDTCSGESVADCPALRGKVSTPHEWSYRYEEDER